MDQNSRFLELAFCSMTSAGHWLWVLAATLVEHCGLRGEALRTGPNHRRHPTLSNEAIQGNPKRKKKKSKQEIVAGGNTEGSHGAGTAQPTCFVVLRPELLPVFK